MSDAPLLLIEDIPSLQLVYRAVLQRAGLAVDTATTAREGLEIFRKGKPDVVVLDMMLPDRDGLELMQELLKIRPGTRVIVITANGTISRAVEAMRAGAHEFLVKPFDDQRFLHAIENARAALRAPLPAEDEEVATAPTGDFIGQSPAMKEVYSRIRSVARSMATVFITGESGTGKELCAQAIHRTSNRAEGPFVALNCGAIPADLLESEVFGHLKGSFSGAIADKIGAAAAADGGTLFLDEICEMDLNLQTKLLRFLQTSTIQPVGTSKPRKVNVRILCATNRDPMETVRRGQFREDLYYRLHVIPIHMPPLRERGDDVIEIAEKLLRRFSREEQRHFTGFSDEVKEIFRRLDWPGNVRQLLNVVLNVVVLHDGTLVTADMLPLDLRRSDTRQAAQAPAPKAAPDLNMLAGKTLAQIERLVIENAIERHNGSVPRAARELDVSASTLYRKREGWQKSGDAAE
ncbi:sigma-54-dependent transcriptional regulator [Plastorhodobacter daqingensis]|uniref:Sigma-54-dependent transcriptional regulator n=1 Tax=Plastorhodobacter daqingensis TaxID=1387281 RepID=A0ABW2UH61_9RHOB